MSKGLGELGYSEAAAGHICQAQSFPDLNPGQKQECGLNQSEKKEILAKLESKSAREGQKILLSVGNAMGVQSILPREQERAVSPEHIEFRFIGNQELKNELERSVR